MILYHVKRIFIYVRLVTNVIRKIFNMIKIVTSYQSYFGVLTSDLRNEEMPSSSMRIYQNNSNRKFICRIVF